MQLDAVIWDWISFAIRWAHVIVGIGWIGASFYFIALDLGLRRRDGMPEGVHGEEWQVHGGGFYHVQKYLVAPDALPEHLIWFKWEAYLTWLTGFALLFVVYYLGAELYLVDPNVLDIPVWAAIAISAGSLALGWIAYDLLCKSKFGDDNFKLMLLLYVLLVVIAWGYTQVFSGRAALLHLGAFTATIMSANVFFIIMPNQRIVVDDLKAGRTPDPRYGTIAKQRSTHNNYLTLPVLFLMLSNHYPLAFATEYNWIIASLVFLMGVSIRHYFNTVDAHKGNPLWTWGVTALIFAAIVALSVAGRPDLEGEDETALSPHQQRFADAPDFEEVYDTVASRCAMCHAREPVWEGMAVAPKGVLLETEADIAAHAKDIYLQSGVSTAMPPANISYMEAEERRRIVEWYEAARSGAAGG